MIKITFLKILPIAFIVILLVSSCKKEPLPKSQVDYKVFSYKSKVIGEEYLLPIYFPENYDTNKRYPVLYTLDGNTNFLIVAEKVKNAIKNKEIPPHLVVGIAYPGENKRDRDYTPTYVKNEGEGKVGDFFKFITTELVRVIETNFSVDTGRINRAITGHSYGGIACLYGMFNHQETFSKFIIGSPSLWYDDNVFFQYEKEYYENNNNLSAKVYIGMGGFEEGWMEPLFLEFTKRLKQRNYRDLYLITKMYPKEDHTSVFPIEMEEGIRYVLK